MSVTLAMGRESVPSFHDTNVQILLLLNIRVVAVDLVTLLTVLAVRENRRQLFLRGPGGRQGDRPLLGQATPILANGKRSEPK